jgi:kinetochore protein Nuf2
LNQLLGISIESFELNFDILQELEAPNLHSESLYLMSFYRKVFKLLGEVGILDFNFNEFLNPDRKRLVYILSGLINFSKFRQEKLQLFQNCAARGEEFLGLKDNLSQKKSTILEKISQIKGKLKEEEEQVQEIRNFTIKIGSENRELKKNTSKLESENEGLLLHERELMEKVKNTQFLLNNLKQDCSRLSSKIVRNPDKLKMAIKDMHTSLKEDKSTLQHSEKKSREIISRMGVMASVEQDLKTCIESLQVVQGAKQKSLDILKKYEGEKDVLDSKKQEIKDLEIREGLAKRQLANSTEKLDRLSKHQESKQSINENKLNQLKKDYEIATKESQETLKKVEENDKLSLQIEKKVFSKN